MLVFARAVCRGARRAFVVGDLPFLSYQPSDRDAVRNAGAFIAAGCDAVKCEGGRRVARRVRAMTDAGIAVMGHLGLTPQALGQQGGYRVQAKTLDADRALDRRRAGASRGGRVRASARGDAGGRRRAGAPSASTCSCMASARGRTSTGSSSSRTTCSATFVGDVQPRFVRRYADLDDDITGAFRSYADDVRAKRFPQAEHCYPIDACDEAAIRAALTPPRLTAVAP